MAGRAALPIEVYSFGWRTQAEYLRSVGARVAERAKEDGTFFYTDQGNLILDCAFDPIARPRTLAAQLDARAGIVGHGLFLGLATDVICAGPEGIRHLRRRQ